MKFGTAPTSFGDMTLVWSGGGLCYLGFDEKESLRGFWAHAPEQDSFAANDMAAHVLAIWQGREDPGSLNLILNGTPFQKSVWRVLQEIPKGQVTTYQNIADKIGKPEAARAVGSAIGANPVSLLIPCHRVIRKDGSLGGYLWGIDLKKRILSAEGTAF